MKKKYISLISILSVVLILFTGCTSIHVKTQSVFEAEPKITVVHISDLHFDSKKNIYNDAVEKINAISPDILFITGDIIADKNEVDNFISCFSRLQGTYPKYAVLGNWEYGTRIDIDLFREKLNAIDIKLLINDFDIRIIKNRRIYIYGVDDYLLGKPDFSRLNPRNEKSVVVLAHCPILFDIMQQDAHINSLGDRDDIDVLMLSGHTHGGQITLFGLPLIRTEGSGRYVSGIYRNGNFIMNVNKGLGTSRIDLRVFAAPTIDIISF